MNKKPKYLESVQGVMNRMASNSVMLKGRAVTMVAGTIVFVGKNTDKLYFPVTYVRTCGCFLRIGCLLFVSREIVSLVV